MRGEMNLNDGERVRDWDFELVVLEIIDLIVEDRLVDFVMFKDRLLIKRIDKIVVLIERVNSDEEGGV